MAVTDEAIEKIKAMIDSGQLGPGDRLPREEELAASLGLSRSSLREAVRALTFVRVLDVRHGDGTYVSSLQPELLLDAVSFIIDFHRDDSVLSFLEVRRLVEPGATARAALHADEEDVAQLRKVLAAAHTDLEPTRFIELDRQFHSEVARLARNPVLSSLLESISGPIQRARLWRGLAQADASTRTVQDHTGIVDAIERHDPELAAARAIAHISGLEDWLRNLDGQPAEGAEDIGDPEQGA
jgi:GntR family transcriptional repressor for pyruvate dehydrogenase complex